MSRGKSQTTQSDALPSGLQPHGWSQLEAAAKTATARRLLDRLIRRAERQGRVLSSVDELPEIATDRELPQLARLVAGVEHQPSAPQPSTQESAYSRHKRRAAQRQADLSRQAREIGPLPDVVDPDRREACRLDLRLYLETYHRPAFPLDWSPAHLTCIRRAQTVILEGALFALAMPRGSGKTTICRHAIQWAVNYGHRRYAYLIGANDDAAVASLEAIQLDYATNDLLAEDFPEICYPIRALDGIHNRTKGQLLDGRPTRIQYRRKEFVLPTVAGSPSSGAVIKAGGLLSSLRGANMRLQDGTVIRPDLILLDDPQTRESAESSEQSATRERIVAGDILGMAGPGGEIAALMPCTVISPGDMVDSILDRDKHPEWRGQRTQLLTSWPDNMDLWDQYWDIFSRCLREDEDAPAVPPEATEFYLQHREAMDKGAAVSWEERKRADEVSGIQHAMNLFLRDEASFYSEYQNDPRDPHAEDELLTVDTILSRTSAYARGQVPLGCEWLTAFVDCHKRILYWMVCGWEWNFTGHIIDYGTFPRQSRPTWRAQRARPTLMETYRGQGEEGALYSGLAHLLGELQGRDWQREDGVDMRINRGLVDAGYQATIVRKAIRQNGLASTWNPYFGREIGPGQYPISQYRRRPGELIGLEWLQRAGQGRLRHTIADVNWWKTFAHRRLATAPGDAGSVMLFGREQNGRPANHKFLAQHLTAEVRTTVVGERPVDQWKIKPGGENHWLDCYVGCCVAASQSGAQATPVRESAPVRQTTSLSELRRRKRVRSARGS